MRVILSISCLAALALLGCGEGGSSSSQPTSPASSGNPMTAPVDYLGAVGNAKQRAVKTVDLTSLSQAIQLFQASEERLPKDLNELVSMKYIGKIPEAPYGQKIVYNPANGQVSLVPAQ